MPTRGCRHTEDIFEFREPTWRLQQFIGQQGTSQLTQLATLLAAMWLGSDSLRVRKGGKQSSYLMKRWSFNAARYAFIYIDMFYIWHKYYIIYVHHRCKIRSWICFFFLRCSWHHSKVCFVFRLELGFFFRSNPADRPVDPWGPPR